MEFEQYEAGYAEGGISVNYYWQMRSYHIKLRRSIIKNGATEKAVNGVNVRDIKTGECF